MIDGIPVVDAIVHPHNLDPSNYSNRFGAPITAAMVAGHSRSPDGYRVRPEMFVRDWPMEDIANMSFLESHADIAVTHVLSIGAFKDGMSSFEKAVEAVTRWPDRFIAYCGVDPYQGQQAVDELARQVEYLGTNGVKLYPTSWRGDEVNGWAMDDPEIAFPVFEKARQLGVKVVAVHKAVPLGPVPLDHYGVADLDRAAMEFPELMFEIVHGGMAFIEETAWQLARFPNVYVNLEITGSMVCSAPAAFERVLAGLVQYGGANALNRVLWGSGLGFHPRPILEAFVRDFQFDRELIERGGVPELTMDAKRSIVGGNYARMLGFDLDAKVQAVADDEFSRRRADGLQRAYSTTGVAGSVD